MNEPCCGFVRGWLDAFSGIESGVIEAFRVTPTDRIKLISWKRTGLCLIARKMTNFVNVLGPRGLLSQSA